MEEQLLEGDPTNPRLLWLAKAAARSLAPERSDLAANFERNILYEFRQAQLMKRSYSPGKWRPGTTLIPARAEERPATPRLQWFAGLAIETLAADRPDLRKEMEREVLRVLCHVERLAPVLERL